MTTKEKKLHRIMLRVCEAAVDADNMLHTENISSRAQWRKELCAAVDDYLVGEELPRNKRKGTK